MAPFCSLATFCGTGVHGWDVSFFVTQIIFWRKSRGSNSSIYPAKIVATLKIE